MATDYELVLRIINGDPDPASALANFVRQEREHAEHRVKAEAWDEGLAAGTRLVEHGFASPNPYRH